MRVYASIGGGPFKQDNSPPGAAFQHQFTPAVPAGTVADRFFKQRMYYQVYGQGSLLSLFFQQGSHLYLNILQVRASAWHGNVDGWEGFL